MNLISFFYQVADNLYVVEGEAGAVFPYCHTYLYDTKELIVFDPQCGRGRLKRGLEQLGKRFSDINFIINSHFHADHSRSNPFLKKKSGAKILIHQADREAIESIDEYVKRYGMTDKKQEALWRGTLKMLGFKGAPPDQTFLDKDIIPGGFQVIHTPGHTPGHCCFYKDEILISGDIDLTSPWVGNLTSSVADYLQSIDKIQQLRLKAILPGHGELVFNDFSQKLDTFRERFFKREQKIYDTLPDPPITVVELTERVFQAIATQRKQVEQRQAFFTFHFAMINNLNYLIHLELRGKVQKLTKNGQTYWQKIG